MIFLPVLATRELSLSWYTYKDETRIFVETANFGLLLLEFEGLFCNRFSVNQVTKYYITISLTTPIGGHRIHRCCQKYTSQSLNLNQKFVRLLTTFNKEQKPLDALVRILKLTIFEEKRDINEWYRSLFIQSRLYQGRMSRDVFFLLTCIHPVTSYRAGWIFHPSTSLGNFGSSKLASLCMQARKMRAHLFYLGIDDFAFYSPM